MTGYPEQELGLCPVGTQGGGRDFKSSRSLPCGLGRAGGGQSRRRVFKGVSSLAPVQGGSGLAEDHDSGLEKSGGAWHLERQDLLVTEQVGKGAQEGERDIGGESGCSVRGPDGCVPLQAEESTKKGRSDRDTAGGGWRRSQTLVLEMRSMAASGHKWPQ